MKIEAPELVDLLNLANDMRAAKGDEALNDLPASERRMPSSCLVANAFNYGCRVYPSKYLYNSEIAFNNVEDLNTYVEVTKTTPKYIDREFEIFTGYLTKELNEIAVKFDDGAYREYESLRDTL